VSHSSCILTNTIMRNAEPENLDSAAFSDSDDASADDERESEDEVVIKRNREVCTVLTETQLDLELGSASTALAHPGNSGHRQRPFHPQQQTQQQRPRQPQAHRLHQQSATNLLQGNPSAALHEYSYAHVLTESTLNDELVTLASPRAPASKGRALPRGQTFRHPSRTLSRSAIVEEMRALAEDDTIYFYS
jgi:hypothetical protein